jgi:hypothetical protein
VKLQPEFEEIHMAKALTKQSIPAVTIAAESAGRALARWNAVETEAARVHEEGQGSRAVFDANHIRNYDITRNKGWDGCEEERTPAER